ncbi:MFS transporter [Kribbella sp. NPDC048915]|uniref:MFS transporter n=1 Tax=Kribbella sp. NPDC048915 TaxID=3155148 RepID=UPI0033DDD2FD
MNAVSSPTITPQEPRAWRGLPRVVWVLMLARAVNRVGAFTLPFLGVVLAVEFGASMGETGAALAVFGAATVPSRLLGGQLADRLGRRRTIVLGLTGCAIAQLWIAVNHSLWSAVMATLLLGLVFEIYEPPSQAMIADVTTPFERPRAYGVYSAALAAAGVLAGLVAAAISHWDLRWLFAVDALTCLACAALVARALPNDVRRQQHNEDGKVWRDRRLLILLAGGTVFATIYMQLVIGVPLTLLEHNLPESGTGIILAVSAATLIVAQRVLRTQHLDDFRAIAIGYLLVAVGLVVVAFAHSLATFLAAAVLWSLGELFLLTRYLTQASGLAPNKARGRYLAVFGLSWGIATTIAPLTVTELLETAGPAGLWLTTAAAAVAMAALQPWFRKRLAPA